MTLCRSLVWGFALLWALSIGLLVVGTYGLFGQPQDPLAGVFVILLGSPWVQLAADNIGLPAPVAALIAPGVNLLVLIVLCRLLARRAGPRADG